MAEFTPSISSRGDVLTCRDCGKPLRQLRIRFGLLGEVIETQDTSGTTYCPANGKGHTPYWRKTETIN